MQETPAGPGGDWGFGGHPAGTKGVSMRSFVYSSHPGRVVFGAGTLRQLPDEVRRLGGTRVLLLARSATDEAAWRQLGPLGAAQFSGAAMHTPVEVTGQALDLLREHGADCLVSVGGGTSTGL